MNALRAPSVRSSRVIGPRQTRLSAANASPEGLQRMRTPLCSFVIPIAVLIVPSVARAEDAPHDYPQCDHQPSDSDIQAAKGAFQAGQVSFDEADYQRAITYWEDAYRRDCTAHALLLNLSRAYELSGKKQQAVISLDTYLQRNPNANDKDKILRRIDVLKQQIAAEQPAPTQPHAAAPPPTATPATPPPDTGVAPAGNGGKRPVLPLIVAGGGAAVALVSLFPYLSASSDVSHYESLCNGNRNACPPNVVTPANDARTRQTIWGAMALVGTGVAAGGVVWYFLQPKQAATTASATPPSPAPPLVSPALGPGFAGLVIDGKF